MDPIGCNSPAILPSELTFHNWITIVQNDFVDRRSLSDDSALRPYCLKIASIYSSGRSDHARNSGRRTWIPSKCPLSLIYNKTYRVVLEHTAGITKICLYDSLLARLLIQMKELWPSLRQLECKTVALFESLVPTYPVDIVVDHLSASTFGKDLSALAPMEPLLFLEMTARWLVAEKHWL